MFEKIIKLLWKLHILKVSSYKAKWDMNDLIDKEVSADFNKSGFYWEASEKVQTKKYFSRLVLLVISYILAILFSLIILVDQWFSFWSLLIIFSWLLYIFFAYKFYKWVNFLWKKLIWSIVLISFLSFIIIWSTWSNSNYSSSLTFSSNVSLTDDIRDKLYTQDTLYEQSFAGPFYFWSFDWLTEYTKSYTELRNKKVSDINDVINNSIDLLDELENNSKKIRGLLDNIILKITTLNPQVKDVFLPLIDDTTKQAVVLNAKLELIKSFRKNTLSYPKDAEEWYLMYSKYMGFVELVNDYNNELLSFNKTFVSLYYMLDASKVEVFKDITLDLDNNLDNLTSTSSELLAKLNYNVGSVVFEEQILYTSDYFYSQEAISFLKQEKEKLNKKLLLYNQEKLSKEELSYLKDVVAEYWTSINLLENALNNIPNEKLLNEDDFKKYIWYNNINNNKVYAIWNPFTWITSKVKSAANATVDFAKAWASMTWKATKAAWSAIKTIASTWVDIAYWASKWVWQVFWAMTDTVWATLKTWFDIVNDIYYWNDIFTWRLDAIKKNYMVLYNNFKNWQLWAEVYKTAIHYWNIMEEWLWEAARYSSSLVFWDWYISSWVWFATKLTTWIFTWLSKDVYTILDPNASKTDTMLSWWWVVLAVTWWTNTVVKSTTWKAWFISLLKRSKDVLKSKGLKTILPNFERRLTNVIKRESLLWLWSKLKTSIKDFSVNFTKKMKWWLDNLVDEVSWNVKNFKLSKYLKPEDNVNQGLSLVKEMLWWGKWKLSENLSWYFDVLTWSHFDNLLKDYLGGFINGITIANASDEVKQKINNDLLKDYDPDLEKLKKELKQLQIDTKHLEKSKNDLKKTLENRNIIPKTTSQQSKPVKRITEKTNLWNLQDKLKTEKIWWGSSTESTPKVCNPPYVKDWKWWCIAWSTYCAEHYKNMVYDQNKNYCVCKSWYIEQSHWVCINEAEKLQEIANCKSKCDFRTNPETYTKCVVPCSNKCAEWYDFSKAADVQKSRECFENCKSNRYNNCIASCK